MHRLYCRNTLVKSHLIHFEFDTDMTRFVKSVLYSNVKYCIHSFRCMYMLGLRVHAECVVIYRYVYIPNCSYINEFDCE
jgi:hypothetical protein